MSTSGLAKKRLIIWLGLTCLVTAGFGLNIWLAHRQKLADAQTLTGNLVYAYSTVTEHLLDELDRFIGYGLRHWLDKTLKMQQLQTLLDAQLAVHPYVMDFLILNADGEIMLWTGSGPVPDVRDRDYYQAHLQNPGQTLYIGKTLPSRVHPGRWFFSLSRALRSPEGALLGVGVAVIDREAFQTKYEGLLDTPEVSVGLLYGPEGRFVVRAPAVREDITGQKAPSTQNLTLPLEKPVTVLLPHAVDGYKRLVSLRPLERYPALTLSSTVRVDFALKKWLAPAVTLLVFWLLFSVALWRFSGRYIRLQQEKDEAKKQQEIQAKADEARFRLAAEKTGQLIYEYTPHTNLLVWAGAVERLTGYPGNAFACASLQAWEAMIHPEDRERITTVLKQARLLEGSIDAECRMQRKDGSYFDAEIHGSFFTAETGEQKMIGAISDITRRKEYERAQEALSRTLEERVRYEVGRRMEVEHKKREQEKLLIQQSKMAAMGEMIGAIAHQWRQPLNSLGLYIQDVEDAWRHGELSGEYLKGVTEKSMRQIHFMSQTINDFRNFFKPDKNKHLFDLKHMVEHTLSLVSAQLHGHNIAVETLLPERPLMIDGYENELGQALLNLLSNAKDALDERRPTGPWIRVTLSQRGDEALLCVEDNGGGVPEPLLERIFEPYFTTKEEGKGSGIGLYMSKMIVEQNMQGVITAQNTQHGARLCMTLPLGEPHET